MKAAYRAALLLALLPAGPASAGTKAASYQDVVRLPPDANGVAWHQVGGAVAPDERIAKWVPEGQTDLDWTQSITIRTIAPSRDPAAIVQRSLSLLRGLCGKLSVDKKSPRQFLGDGPGQGLPMPVFAATDLSVTCLDLNLPALRKKFGTENVEWRRNQVTSYRLLRGERQNFIVQRAWRGETIDAASPLASTETRDAWQHWLTGVTLVRERATR